ncbi:hypothetical protein ACM66B_005623 [Microbotryomycetes sp. NB124-2]
MAPVPIGWRTLEQLFTYTALVLLTSLATKRVPNSWSWRRWTQGRSLSNWLTTLIMLDSVVFMYATGVLRAINARGPGSCSIGIIFCFIFYAITKVLFFWYFTEQSERTAHNTLLNVELTLARRGSPVFIVYAHPVTGSLAQAPSRIKSRWYILSTLMMCIWFSAGMTMLMGRISYQDMQGTCYIGLRLYAGATVVVLQATCNMYLLLSFLLALKSSWLQGEGRQVARKCSIAIVIALVTTALNIGGLVAEHQGMAAWICVVCCGSDVVINAITLFIITAPETSPTAQSTIYGAQDMTRTVSRPTRRKSFVSQFGTSLPPQPVVPGIGFEEPRTQELQRVSTDLGRQEDGDFKWDSADPESGGGSPYGLNWRDSRA